MVKVTFIKRRLPVMPAFTMSGFMDDLDAMAKGETLASALGMFAEGDRVVVRRSTMEQLVKPIAESHRFGTVNRTTTLTGDVFVYVAHDDHPNEHRWEASDLMLFDDWINSKDCNPDCADCYDTTFKGYQPGTGDCPKCSGESANYARSDKAWAEARRRRKAKR